MRMTSVFRHDGACALRIGGRDCWFASPYNSACNALQGVRSGWRCRPITPRQLLARRPVSYLGRQRLEAEHVNDPRAPDRLTTAKHLSIYRIRSLADLSTLLTSPATAGGCSSAAGRALLRRHCRRDQELRARCRPQLATKGSPCCQEGHSVLSWTLGPRNTAPGRGALAGRLTRTKHVKGCWRQQMPTTRRRDLCAPG